MGFEIEYSAGQAPLDDDEKDGLLIFNRYNQR